MMDLMRFWTSLPRIRSVTMDFHWSRNQYEIYAIQQPDHQQTLGVSITYEGNAEFRVRGGWLGDKKGTLRSEAYTSLLRRDREVTTHD